MANVYAVKYVTVAEISATPVLVGEVDGKNVHSDKVRVPKEGSINVLADSQQQAGQIAEAHLKTGNLAEVNIHLVHEVAKNVIVASIIEAIEPDVTTLLDQADDVPSPEESTAPDAA